MYNKIVFILILAGFTTLFATPADDIIKKIEKQERDALARITYADFKPLENYKGRYYFIPQVIGQNSLRSLLGCLKNPDGKVRKICADYMYTLKVNYIHKKYIRDYLKKEEYPPARLSLQDLLIKMNLARFLEAKNSGDAAFLAKIEFTEILDFVEKGLPGSEPGRKEESINREIRFYSGGFHSKDSKIRSFSSVMLWELQKEFPAKKNSVQKILENNSKAEKNPNTKKLLRKLTLCIKEPKIPCRVSPNEY